MTSLLFLLGAVVLSVVGCAIFLFCHRKPSSLEHGIDAFSREMRALAPDRPRPGSTSRARGASRPKARPYAGGDPRRR